MKLSEKALRHIGLTVLKIMDNENFQDKSKHPGNSAQPGGDGRPRLTMEARLNAAKAPVIPFHRKKPAS